MTVNIEEELLCLNNDGADTAKLLEFLDGLFDSLNGSSFQPTPGKDLRTAVKEGSGHISFWNNALDKLRSFHFIRNGKLFSPPSLINLIKTIQNFKLLWTTVNNLGFEYLMPRTFN